MKGVCSETRVKSKFISFSSKNASIYIELHRELILSIFTWRVQGLQFEYYTDELYRETIT